MLQAVPPCVGTLCQLGLLLQEEVVLLLRRQSKGFVRTNTKFKGVTKDRVCRCASQTSICLRSALHTTCSYFTNKLLHSPAFRDLLYSLQHVNSGPLRVGAHHRQICYKNVLR